MADEKGRFNQPVTVTLKGIGSKTFKTVTQLSDWAQKEGEFWVSLKGQLNNSFMGSLIPVDDYINQTSVLLRSSKDVLNAPDSNERNQHLQRINQVLRYYNNGHIPVSTSEECRQIAELAQEDPDTAIIALFRARDGFTNIERTPDQRVKFNQIPNIATFMRAWFALEADTLDRQKSLDRQKQSLNALRSRWDHHLSKAEESEKALATKFKERERRLAKIAFGRLRKYRELHKTHEQDMAGMLQAFSTDMKLRAAEKFWGEKRRLNRKREKTAFARLCWVGGLGFLALMVSYFVIYWLFGVPETFSVTHAVVYFIPTLIYIWLLRIIASEYKSNKNMADDAEEREAMVMTFKALEYEDKVSDEERLVILSALFRPHGESAEETVPVPVWEAIVGKLGRPG